MHPQGRRHLRFVSFEFPGRRFDEELLELFLGVFEADFLLDEVVDQEFHFLMERFFIDFWP